ncbi:phosphoethanolamine transferase [Foetidibacter luteolus]|uniref:phosphoethanolamine transferase n=1 Tax=Foetidibacter luteolus TaxID=2608880 RepID=UPI001A98352B|nr:phosphoethanolamine transferase [Foetidibacter luteolus]
MPFFRKNPITSLAAIAGCITLLVLPGLFALNKRESHQPFFYNAAQLITSFLFMLLPAALFYRNIKLYLYLLLILIIPSTLFIFSIYYFDVWPGFEMVVLSLQTNLTEVREIGAGYVKWYLPLTIVYVVLYLLCVKALPFKRISLFAAISISVLSCLVIGWKLRFEKHLYKFNNYDLLNRYYPASVASGIAQAYSILKKNNLSAAGNFSFGAYKKDSLPHRQIYLFIIGEASRYDRWQVNGYDSVTSPRLAVREGLLSFPDVISGSNLTWMSVPQMITRATPDNIDLQFKEKSIITAFKEAGFRTAWLSNQSDKEIFWGGTINLHAKTADAAVFSPTQSPNFELEDYYDERLLPLLDSIINIDNRDLFIVLHTMGNHWDYARRYPEDFDYYQPSGYTTSINPPDMSSRLAISNSYDNSILYADYVIDSAIDIINRHNALSYVMYLSDHGDDLFDASEEQIDFHLKASPITLHVPLFLWTSPLYNQVHGFKTAQLAQNRDKKIGSENTFFSLLDLANIDFKGNDLTKSIASPSFSGSIQKFFDNDDRKAYYYKDLLE